MERGLLAHKATPLETGYSSTELLFGRSTLPMVYEKEVTLEDKMKHYSELLKLKISDKFYHDKCNRVDIERTRTR